MPRSKNCTASNSQVATMTLQLNSGTRDLFKTNFFCKDVFNFFYKDENQNAPKLQRRIAYFLINKAAKLGLSQHILWPNTNI